ncbi:MAG: hypothetical protein DRR19_13485, partial [Candidatus Parabeggiatoa sp. nov. 1]
AFQGIVSVKSGKVAPDAIPTFQGIVSVKSGKVAPDAIPAFRGFDTDTIPKRDSIRFPERDSIFYYGYYPKKG